MALKSIPSTPISYEIVDKLPKEGVENTIYNVQVYDEDAESYNIVETKIYFGGEWLDADMGLSAFRSVFNAYQESVAEIIGELTARIEELEGGSEILFIGNNIEIVESWNSIEKTVSVATEITLPEVANVKIEMTNMTIDGEPIDDVTDTIQLGNLESWDWKGGECYADVFLPAYFTFGTKPMNGVVNQITLGFTNEQESFKPRTLVIGHLKVEVV